MEERKVENIEEQEDLLELETTEKKEYEQYKGRFRLHCIYKLAAYGIGVLTGLLAFFLPLIQSSSGKIFLFDVAKLLVKGNLGIYDVFWIFAIIFLLVAIVMLGVEGAKATHGLTDLDGYALVEYDKIRVRREEKAVKIIRKILFITWWRRLYFSCSRRGGFLLRNGLACGDLLVWRARNEYYC